MKYKILAVLIAAAASSGVYAQTSVTLYSVADIGVEFLNQAGALGQNAGGTHSAHAVRQSSGSRFGPRCSEDLGGGMKAIFTLESGFNLGSGASEQGGRLFGRRAFVGVDSRSGALTLGRQYNLLFDNMLELDPMSAAQYSAVVHDQAFVGRADKSIKYSGNFSGVKVGALYSFGRDTLDPSLAGEDPGDRSRGAEWGLSVGYQSGPMNFEVVYDEVKSISAREFGTFASAFQAVPNNLSQLYNLSGNEKARRIAAAGSYAFGNVKVFAGYRYLNTNAPTRVDGAGADKFHSDLYWLGATWQATPAMGLTAAAYHSNNKRNPSVTSYVLGVDYKMSKRTDLYTNLSYADNRAKSGIESAQSVDAGRTTPAGKDQFGAQVGIRHWF